MTDQQQYPVVLVPQPVNEQKPASPSTAWRLLVFMWRHRIELAPPATSLALVQIAQVAAETTEPFGPVGNTLAAGGLIGAAMWYYAPRKWDRDAEVMYARWGTIAAAAWVYLVVRYGLDTATWWLLAIGTLTGGALWWKHKLPIFNRPNKFTREWQAIWEEVASAQKANVPYSEIISAEGSDRYARMVVHLGNHSYADVQKILEPLAQWLRVGRATLTLQEVEDDAALAVLVFRQVAKIDGGVEWDDALAPTTTVGDLYLGMRETGEPFLRRLTSHMALIGVSQWGKSFMLQCLMANWASTDDTVVFFIDLKGGNTARIWANGIAWIATTYEEALLLVATLNYWIKLRAGSDMKVPHQPSPESPRYILVFDEVAEGLGKPAPDKRLLSLLLTYVQQGLGVGFYFVGTAQDSSLESWGSGPMRKQLITSLVFKTRKRSDAADMLDSTRACDTTKIKIEGSFFYHGAKEGDIPDMMRGVDMNPDGENKLARRIQAERAHLMATVEPWLAEAAGEVWSGRFDRMPDNIKRSLGITDGGRSPARTKTLDPAAEYAHDGVRVHDGEGMRALPDPDARAQDPATRAHHLDDEHAHGGGGAHAGDDEHAEQSGVERALEARAEIDRLMRGCTLTPEDLGKVSGNEVMQGEDEKQYKLCRLIVTAGPKGIKAVDIYGNEALGYRRSYVTERLGLLASLGWVTSDRGRYYAKADARAGDLMKALIDAWSTRRQR